MNTNTVIEAVNNSPVFEAITADLNKYVEKCNAAGHVISKEERDILNNLRFLITCKSDPNAFRALAGDVWETVNA